MNIPLLVRDEFADDVREVRAALLAGEFSTRTGPDGAAYTGISEHPAPEAWFDRVAEVVGAPIVPRLHCFRLNLAGELPHSWVHSDDICAQFASVLYLNTPEQCLGGTSFWKHKGLNLNALPSVEELQKLELDPAAFYALMTREWKVLDAWQQVSHIPMQFNRFITYPTSYFHSRFPFEGFGSGPADGRLIWVCFYDLKKEEQPT